MTAFDELIAHNASLYARHRRLRAFQMFGDGTLERPAQRDIFFGCIQAFSRAFQAILLMRQAHTSDERYAGIFRTHLREEIGHDEILSRDRGRSDQVWDPVIEGACAWFVLQMSTLDNVEKLAVVHLVLESSGAYMGSVSKDPMRGRADYFGVHDELDSHHVDMALAPLREQSPSALQRVRVVVEHAWRMMDLFVERVAALTEGQLC